jgi:D-alanyl-D-alanine carboxypeptidase
MPDFGERSRENLLTVHPDLRAIAYAAIARIDFAVIEGHRGEGRQNELFKAGMSKQQYPNGNHNTWPSLAFDFVPWPFEGTDADWLDSARFKSASDILIEEGEKVGIVLFWGGNWKSLSDTDHIQMVSKNGVEYPKTFKIVDP